MLGIASSAPTDKSNEYRTDFECNKYLMFFSDSRQHFFNPLTGKYRELVAQCLSLLYQRLYTDLRDMVMP